GIGVGDTPFGIPPERVTSAAPAERTSAALTVGSSVSAGFAASAAPGTDERHASRRSASRLPSVLSWAMIIIPTPNPIRPIPAAPPERRYGSWHCTESLLAAPDHPNPIATKPPTHSARPTRRVSWV